MIRIAKYFLLSSLCLLCSAAGLPGQWRRDTISRPVVEPGVSQTREVLAISYPEGKKIAVTLQGTRRLPGARGNARVRRGKGVTAIDISLDQLKPAYLFGGDYSTYVLWTVSPQGQVDNVGEVIQDGRTGHMKVTTPLETFGLFVTAEPDYLVRTPSRFVVIETVRPEKPISGSLIHISRIEYRGFEGVYRFDRESLAEVDYVEGEVQPHVREAQAAINVAMLAGADRYAPAELNHARDRMAALDAAVRAGSDSGSVSLMAHEVIRLATDAQTLAEQRAPMAALQAGEPSTGRVLPRAELPPENMPPSQLSPPANAQDWSRLNVVLPDSAFDMTTSTLLPQGREMLSRLAAVLRGSRGYSKVIVRGPGAGTIADFLIESGVPAGVLVVEGVNPNYPVPQTYRPVEVIIE